MRKIGVLALVFFSTFFVSAQTSPAGLWNTGQQNTKVEISKVEEAMQGVILSSDNEKAAVGKLLLKDIKKAGEAYKGKVYAIKKKRWLDAVLVRKGEKLLITVSAGWRKKKLEWSAVN